MANVRGVLKRVNSYMDRDFAQSAGIFSERLEKLMEASSSTDNRAYSLLVRVRVKVVVRTIAFTRLWMCSFIM